MRRLRKRFGARRPSNMQWSAIDVPFVFAGVTAASTAVLVQLQSPATLANLTADPPEDLTILRIRGNFQVSLSTTGNWTLGLTVQDVTWTPSATFSEDADKRILWSQTYEASTAVVHTWTPPGYLLVTAAGLLYAGPDATHLDISPRVKVEPGKALYLVAWENTGAATMTVTCEDMRCLYKRSGRR